LAAVNSPLIIPIDSEYDISFSEQKKKEIKKGKKDNNPQASTPLPCQTYSDIFLLQLLMGASFKLPHLPASWQGSFLPAFSSS